MFNLAYVPKCGSSILHNNFDCFKHTTDFVPENAVLLLRDPFDRALTEQIHIQTKYDKISLNEYFYVGLVFV